MADTVARLAGVFAEIAYLHARGGIAENLADACTNSDGDGQKALDVIADDAFRAALQGSAVRHYASEEQEEVITLDPAERWYQGRPRWIVVEHDTTRSWSTLPSMTCRRNRRGASPRARAQGGGLCDLWPATRLDADLGEGVLKFVLDPGDRGFVGSAGSRRS